MTEPIMFELDGGQVETPDELYSGSSVNKEGFYHVECVDVTLNTPDPEKDERFTPNVQLQLHVLAGDHPDQVEKMIYHRINLAKFDKETNQAVALDDRALKNIRCVLFAFGVISQEDLGNPSLKVNFSALVDKQAIVKVSHEPPQTYTAADGTQKTTKDRYRISWHNDIFPLGAEQVKDVPKDMQAYGLALQQSSPEEMNKQMDELLSGLD